MTEIKSSDFARHKGELLDRASRGETFLITRYGRPLAVLAPPEMLDRLNAQQAAA